VDDDHRRCANEEGEEVDEEHDRPAENPGIDPDIVPVGVEKVGRDDIRREEHAADVADEEVGEGAE